MSILIFHGTPVGQRVWWCVCVQGLKRAMSSDQGRQQQVQQAAEAAAAAAAAATSAIKSTTRTNRQDVQILYQCVVRKLQVCVGEKRLVMFPSGQNTPRGPTDCPNPKPSPREVIKTAARGYCRKEKEQRTGNEWMRPKEESARWVGVVAE